MIKEFLREEGRLERLFLLLLWLLFLGFFLLSLTKPLYQDEGVFLSIGKGLSQGKLPYLDFWDHKTPGIYFILGWLFTVFGTKVIFYKLFIWTINAVTGLLVMRISDKVKFGSGRYVIILFLLTVVFFEGNYINAGPFLAFFLALSAYLLVNHKGWKPTLGAGAAVAAALLIKQTAVFSILPLIIYLLFKRRFKYLPSLIAGFGLIILALRLYLLKNGLLTEFNNQVFTVNLKSYPPEAIQSVLTHWLQNFSRVWWLPAGFFIGLLSRSIKWPEKTFFILMALLPVYGYMVRHYPHYWLQSLPFLAILSGLGFMTIIDWLRDKNYRLVMFPLGALIIISITGNLLWFKWVTENKNLNKGAEETRVTETLMTHQADYILAENRYTGFYFLGKQQPLVKYLYLTEVNESENARTKTLEELSSKQRVIIMWPTDNATVYAPEIGEWIIANTEKISDYPALEMSVYYRN